MAAFNKFNQFVEDRNHGVHNFSTDTIKVMLTNIAPVSANSIKADLTEISAGNGYPAGGATLNVTASQQTDGLYKLVVDDELVTAAGGTIGPFRYAVVYNDTPTSPADPLIAWYDYGTSVSLANGESINLDFDAVNGLFTDQ